MLPELTACPGTLAEGYDTYSTTCRRRMFDSRKVHHVLPYESPLLDSPDLPLFRGNQQHISISGVQEKFSVILDKNKLRLTQAGESGIYILKPIPRLDKNPERMPANEHLSMQLARQIFRIETAENALIFFQNGEPAYLTRRFDLRPDGTRWAVEDFAALAGRTPQTHGAHYKYQGNYLQIFELMRRFLPAYSTEAPKLYARLLFNYLFSNGDAHFKNFALLETPMGDFRLAPAYDLLNTRMHVQDSDFALEEGLLPVSLKKGKIRQQFETLARKAGIPESLAARIHQRFSSRSQAVGELLARSYLDERARRNYWQDYQQRLKRFLR